jgi:radical SAM superfamily enzyme YgiQ (UPF0313 family)
MYKDKMFRMRPESEIFDDLRELRGIYKNLPRVFLADGNALVLKTEALMRIFNYIHELFPECERISLYASPRDLLNKSEADLQALQQNGLGIVYMGIESGDDVILAHINKGVTAEEIIEAGQKAIAQGLVLSTMIISGLGGAKRWREHAVESARVVSAVDPQYISLLTLMIEPDTSLAREVNAGSFTLLSPHEVLLETQLFLENLNVTHAEFRSNHASNYISLKGQLPRDITQLKRTVIKALGISEDQYDMQVRRL